MSETVENKSSFKISETKRWAIYAGILWTLIIFGVIWFILDNRSSNNRTRQQFVEDSIIHDSIKEERLAKRRADTVEMIKSSNLVKDNYYNNNVGNIWFIVKYYGRKVKTTKTSYNVTILFDGEVIKKYNELDNSLFFNSDKHVKEYCRNHSTIASVINMTEYSACLEHTTATGDFIVDNQYEDVNGYMWLLIHKKHVTLDSINTSMGMLYTFNTNINEYIISKIYSHEGTVDIKKVSIKLNNYSLYKMTYSKIDKIIRYDTVLDIDGIRKGLFIGDNNGRGIMPD
jgi:hypothetical protein